MNQAELINDIPLQTAIAAHNGTSFSPERRGESERNGYAQTLAEDYAELARLVERKPDLQPVLEAEFARYREGYRARFLSYLHSSANCVSSFIAGPSNFPAARMNKRAGWAHNKLNELLDFRKRALEAIRRTLCPELRPIMAGDADAVQRLQADIDEAEKLQARMLAINKAHQAFLKDPPSLDASVLPEETKQKIRTYKPEYSWEPHPIPPYRLTNNSANIRRMKQRLAGISAAKAAPAVEVEGDKAQFEDCPADNRVRLYFPGKPPVETRARLKANGFRWAPTLGCWQAYRNASARAIAQAEAGILPNGAADLPSTPAPRNWHDVGPDKCALAPAFIAAIEAIAAAGGQTPEAVFALWRRYSQECSGADQSALISEFQEWYKGPLGLAAPLAFPEL